MILIVTVAVVIVVLAAVINITASTAPLNTPHLASAIILTLAVALQRVEGVRKWISNPTTSRKHQAEIIAQQTLINLCRNRTLTDKLLELRVHVWEVPRWYRKVFPYGLRCFLKRVAARLTGTHIRRWTIRPTLRRAAGIGLTKKAPSGVRFRKGIGLIGVCIANNNPGEYVTLNLDEQRKEALKSDTEEKWKSYGPDITHNISLTDAQRLGRSYGHVTSLVVQDLDSGEAIGCVTISTNKPSSELANLAVKQSLTDLANTMAILLKLSETETEGDIEYASSSDIAWRA